MTDQTAAVEVWARMLCAADVHVNDGDHIAWQQLPRLMQDDYRKAARWLLPRLTVAQPASASSVPADADLRDRIAQALLAADTYAQLERRDDRERFADAIMPVLPAPADRAAVLREAAVIADQLPTPDCAEMSSLTNAWDCGTYAVATELRRRADEAQQPETQAENPARIDHLRPEFTDHASVEAIDTQLQRARSQLRRWHLRVEWLTSLRQARVDQKERGEWPAPVSQPDEAQQP